MQRGLGFEFPLGGRMPPSRTRAFLAGGPALAAGSEFGMAGWGWLWPKGGVGAFGYGPCESARRL